MQAGLSVLRDPRVLSQFCQYLQWNPVKCPYFTQLCFIIFFFIMEQSGGNNGIISNKLPSKVL